VYDDCGMEYIAPSRAVSLSEFKDLTIKAGSRHNMIIAGSGELQNEKGRIHTGIGSDKDREQARASDRTVAIRAASEIGEEAVRRGGLH